MAFTTTETVPAKRWMKRIRDFVKSTTRVSESSFTTDSTSSEEELRDLTDLALCAAKEYSRQNGIKLEWYPVEESHTTFSDSLESIIAALQEHASSRTPTKTDSGNCSNGLLPEEVEC